MKYVVTIAGRTIEVTVQGELVTVDGVDHRGELREVPGTPVRNLLLDGSSWIVPIQSLGAGRWALQRRGERFEAEVIDERTRHIRSLVGEREEQAGPAILRAPMPGLVVRLLVAAGDRVRRGDGLVVLEAMKMENELKAPADGVVVSVTITAGVAVEKGAVLVKLEHDRVAPE